MAEPTGQTLLRLAADVGYALTQSSEAEEIVSENGNGTWYEVRLQDGTLCTVTIEASRG